jgi:hypothetical protein
MPTYELKVLHKSPPLFRIPNFLSSEECDAIIKAAIDNNEEATGLVLCTFLCVCLSVSVSVSLCVPVCVCVSVSVSV